MRFSILNLLALTSTLAYLLTFGRYHPSVAIIAGWIVAPVLMTSVSCMFQNVDPSGRRLAIYSALGTMALLICVFSPVLAILNFVWWLPQMFVVEYFHRPWQRTYRHKSVSDSDPLNPNRAP